MNKINRVLFRIKIISQHFSLELGCGHCHPLILDFFVIVKKYVIFQGNRINVLLVDKK